MAEDDTLVTEDDRLKSVELVQEDLNGDSFDDDYDDEYDDDDAGGGESTAIMIHRSSYTDNYLRGISDKLILKRPCILSVDTIAQIIDIVSLLLLNIFVIVWYNENKFARADIFWAIFAFSFLSSCNKNQYNVITMILQIGQYILYSYFCDWITIPLIVFSVLLFLMFSCKLLPLLVIRFCIDPTSYIIHQRLLKKQKIILNDTSHCKCNCEGIFIVITTVPLFYFNQS